METIDTGNLLISIIASQKQTIEKRRGKEEFNFLIEYKIIFIRDELLIELAQFQTCLEQVFQLEHFNMKDE